MNSSDQSEVNTEIQHIKASQINTRIYHLTMETDKEASEFVNKHRAAVEQVNGELWFSCGFGNVKPISVMVLPDGQSPESLVPGFTWTEYTGA